jgi:hypothetical protein
MNCESIRGGVEQQLLKIVLDNIGADPLKHNKIKNYYLLLI